jgi:2,3-bisphosphoglycerate-independent phosphoglycerate mutase
MQTNDTRVCLIILDGWGHGRKDRSDAVYQAETPFADFLDRTHPNGELRTDGENVGLPEGQMGNSEVGHMNIGAGRIVYQDLVRINKSIRDHEFNRQPVLLSAIQSARDRGVGLHFIGLVSDGGVHSHIDHLKALCDLAHNQSYPAFIHAFTDGRDTDPHSGKEFILELEKHILGSQNKIASITGRYYAMDRDKRWERVKKAYDLLVSGTGSAFTSADEAISYWYQKGITDEFIEPSVITGETGSAIARIQPGDVVICFNFRTDRCREITEVLTQKSFPEFGMAPIELEYVTMTNYDDSFRHIKVVFDKDNLAMTLGEVISRSGKTQVRIAETEKYPHVTFFFSGGREKVFDGERRIMINSPKVSTYDLQPEMSAPEVAEAISQDMRHNHPDFICLNFANPDMVGHTGVYSAIVKAVEATDRCLKKVVETGLDNGYSFVIIADHGNADNALNEDGSPNTAHSTNPVPVWILHTGVHQVNSGILADVAPTILKMMGLTQPGEMSGESLI